MSKERAWMPFHIGPYLGDTGHLSTLEHGGYLLLIIHYWRTGGLPCEDKQLRAITRMSPDEWSASRGTLLAFFDEDLRHKRIDAELARAVVVSEKRKVAGQRGGMASSISRSLGATPKQILKQTGSNCSDFATGFGQAKAYTITKKEREEERESGEKVGTGGSLATAPLRGARREPPGDRSVVVSEKAVQNLLAPDGRKLTGARG